MNMATTDPDIPNPKEIRTIVPGDTPKKNSQDLTNPTDRLVFDILTKHGRKIRGELVSETGIARSTLYDALNRLILKKLVFKSSKPQGPGRPKVYFTTEKPII